jgi:hypothetical protein
MKSGVRPPTFDLNHLLDHFINKFIQAKKKKETMNYNLH